MLCNKLEEFFGGQSVMFSVFVVNVSENQNFNLWVKGLIAAERNRVLQIMLQTPPDRDFVRIKYQ
jgi:hypothetical protein